MLTKNKSKAKKKTKIRLNALTDAPGSGLYPFLQNVPKCTLFLPFPHNRVKVSVHSTDLCDLRANFQIF